MCEESEGPKVIFGARSTSCIQACSSVGKHLDELNSRKNGEDVCVFLGAEEFRKLHALLAKGKTL